jgi:hypothetical protein
MVLVMKNRPLEVRLAMPTIFEHLIDFDTDWQFANDPLQSSSAVS